MFILDIEKLREVLWITEGNNRSTKYKEKKNSYINNDDF